MTRTEYGGAWVGDDRELNNPMTAAEAEVRFASKVPQDWFSAAVYADTTPHGGIPDFTLEIVPGPSYISVSFYNSAGSILFQYGFRTHEGAMFLESVTSWDYPDQNTFYRRNKSLVTSNRSFQTDGTMHWRSSDKVRGVVEEFDAADIDVSKHWEPIPRFGEWASIGRFER